jgi:signal peptidase I
MRKFLRVLGWTTLVVAVIVGGLRYTVLDWWQIPADDLVLSGSMAPNLAGGDFVLLYRATPKFGDLVRCTDPEEPARFVVGRIMGEPGDTVELTNTDITVNGKRSYPDMTCGKTKVQVENPSTGAPEELHCAIEAANGHKHMRVTRLGAGPLALGKRVVSEGNVFLVSDNRAWPMDSRQYGAVPRATCKEQIFFRMYGKAGLGDVETRFTYIK